MKNVVAYVRVSTDAQAGEDRYGVEAQKEEIRAYAERKGLKIQKWYQDLGESGAKERPGFDAIVFGDVTNPPIDTVLVAKSDRVARDINVYYYYKMMLKTRHPIPAIISRNSRAETFASRSARFRSCGRSSARPSPQTG